MRRHNQITVTQRGVVDRGVVVGGSKMWKFSTQHEHLSPQSNLNQVRRERSQHGQHDHWKIAPEAPAGATQSSLAAKQVQRHAHRQGVDEDCT